MSTPPTLKALNAICQCGQIKITLPGPPKKLFVCHCLSCRAQSSSAFGLSCLYPANSLTLPSTLKVWERSTDSGNTIKCYFCENCGVRMVHVNSGGYISVKGGTIQGMEGWDWGEATHLYTRSKLPWIRIPEGVEQYEAEVPR